MTAVIGFIAVCIVVIVIAVMCWLFAKVYK